jgi:superfamily II DNA helicase RecQ
LSVSSQFSKSSKEDARSQCGHCDNCTRPPDSVDHLDVTIEAWRVSKFVEAVSQAKARITLTKLGELVRGKGSGALKASACGKRRVRDGETVNFDVEAIAGGKVNLNKDVRNLPRICPKTLMMPHFPRTPKHSWSISWHPSTWGSSMKATTTPQMSI